jgi:hypothetical protein
MPSLGGDGTLAVPFILAVPFYSGFPDRSLELRQAGSDRLSFVGRSHEDEGMNMRIMSLNHRDKDL